METNNSAAEEKAARVFDLIKENNTWFDFWLKTKERECQLSGV